jgi:hypothetical protein
MLALNSEILRSAQDDNASSFSEQQTKMPPDGGIFVWG